MSNQNAESSSKPAPPAASTQPGASPRGRGRGFRRSNDRRNEQKARAQINPAGAPIQLGDKFQGFTVAERGNAKIEINHSFTENVASDYRNVIKTSQEANSRFDQAGNALDLDLLTRGLAGGLCLSTALKLLSATPGGQRPDVSFLDALQHYEIDVPVKFVTILDLIGKCDYQDWTLRIEDNPGLIQRMLLKAIKYFKQDPDFTADYVFLNAADTLLFNALDPISMLDFELIFFADRISAKRIKAKAKDWLDSKLSENFQITIGAHDITFSYPQLPADITHNSIIDWLAMLNAAHHPDMNAIAFTGVLLLIDQCWLENPTLTMQQIDANFTNTPVAAQTPVQLLNACGLHHYTEYLSKEHFIQISRSCFTYYQTTITNRLRNITTLTKQGKQSLGSPAQLVMVPPEYRVVRHDHGLTRRDVDPACTHSFSFVKLDAAQSVIASSMVTLVKDIELDPDFRGNFAVPLKTIARPYFSADMLYQWKTTNNPH